MKVKLLLLCVGCVLGIACLVIGIPGCGASDDTIQIGAIGPLTGELASYGEWFKNSVEIAQDEINSSGGVLGKKIEVIYEDSQADATTGVTVARKLVDIDRVAALLGPVASGVTLAVAPIAEQNGIVLLSPISSNYRITDAGDYIFRIAPSDALQGRIVAEWTFEELGYATAAILYVTNDYGDGLRQEFERNYVALGGRVVITEGSEQDATDFRSQLTKIAQLLPDFVFVAVYPKETGRVAQQMKEMGIDAPIIGTDPFHDEQVFEIAGAAANGIRFTDVADVSGSEFEAFAAEYRKRYGSEANIVAAESYDGLKVLALAIERAGSLEGSKIRDALYGIKGYTGASGEITFDENGDVSSKTFYKYMIEDGQYKRISD